MHPSRPWSLLSFLVKLDPKQVLLAASRSCCSRKLLEELGAGDRSLVWFLENLEKFCPLVMSSPLIVLSNHWRNYFLENVGVVGGNPSWILMMLSGFSRKCTLHLSYCFFFGSWLITLPPRGFMMLHGSVFVLKNWDVSFKTRLVFSEETWFLGVRSMVQDQNLVHRRVTASRNSSPICPTFIYLWYWCFFHGTHL